MAEGIDREEFITQQRGVLNNREKYYSNKLILTSSISKRF